MLKIELIRFETEDIITSSPPTAASPNQTEIITPIPDKPRPGGPK